MCEIHERALLKAKQYRLAEAELLDAIMEVDREKIYLKFNITHLTPYCVQVLGLSEDVAGYFVRVARKSIVVPELKWAVEEGLSVTKARTIVSVLTQDNKEEWINKAQELSKQKLEIEVAKALPIEKRPEKIKPRGDHFNLNIDISENVRDLIQQAQDLLAQGNGKTRSVSETLEVVLKRFIKQRQSRGGSRGKVIQRDQRQCQAKLSNGRVCGEKKWLHVHHKIPKQYGGTDTAENLITLCSVHHRLHHAREL